MINKIHNINIVFKIIPTGKHLIILIINYYAFSKLKNPTCIILPTEVLKKGFKILRNLYNFQFKCINKNINK